MGRGTAVQVQIVIPGVVEDGTALEIAKLLEKSGYIMDEFHVSEVKKKDGIDMEEVYRKLDNGMPVETLLKTLGDGVTYRMLSYRHRKYQEQLPEAERRTLTGSRKGRPTRPQKDIPMEWVYDRLDEGWTVEEVAKQLKAGVRTIYTKHGEYQEELVRSGNLESRYKRKSLAWKERAPRRDKKIKRLDMEKIYEELMSGSKIGEVAEKHKVSYVTLEKRHMAYQQAHQGETGKYIRAKLVEFKKKTG